MSTQPTGGLYELIVWDYDDELGYFVRHRSNFVELSAADEKARFYNQKQYAIAAQVFQNGVEVVGYGEIQFRYEDTGL